MHTPEQAKDLWCPMARVGVLPGHGGPAGINDPTVEFHINCIADRCAMWHWGTDIAPPLDAEPGKLVAGVNHLAT